MKNLEDKIDLIIENHLVHLKEDISGLKKDIEYLSKFQWIILSTSIGALIINIIR